MKLAKWRKCNGTQYVIIVACGPLKIRLKMWNKLSVCTTIFDIFFQV